MATPKRTSARTSRAGQPAGLARALGYLGGLVLGLVLLVAAFAKAIHPAALADQISQLARDSGFGLPVSAALLALVALGVEFALGFLLVLGVRTRWVLWPTGALIVLFLTITGWEYYRFAHGLVPAGSSCGCFGNLVARSPKEAFFQDLGLLVVPYLMAWLGRPRAGLPGLRIALAAVGSVAGLALAWFAPGMPALDAWATRLKPGITAAELCVGEGADRTCLDTVAPELDAGQHLVVLSELDEPEFLAAVDTLSSYAIDALPDTPQLLVITTQGPEVRQRFHLSAAPAFEPRQAPPALFKPLYRRLPRSFWIEDGTVREAFPGLPPLDRWWVPATVEPSPPVETAP